LRYIGGLILLVLVLAACGKKGAPSPPVPRGPLPARNVAARQIGEYAEVGFALPPARGAKPAQQPVQAELLRVSYPPGPEPPFDPDIFRRRGEVVAQLVFDARPVGSRMRLVDPTLAQLQDAAVGWTLRYALRIRDGKGRASPLVVAADLSPIRAVAPPAGLTGEPTADGVRLEWTADPSGEATYNIYRSAPGSSWSAEPVNPQPLAASEFLDSGVVTGAIYHYTVRVALDAGRPYRESEGSAVLRVVAADRFAPPAPEALVAVQEAAAVRLFWNPNRERDLSGYRVSRRIGDGEWRRIGPDPIEQALYLDRDVSAGQPLAYRVTAVDRANPPNESPPSEVVELELLPETTPPEEPR